MIYEIQSKSSILAGASLIVTIPEEDLDRKALYTIQEDKPEFLLPFRHRAIDGKIEFVYQIGGHCKLQHLVGDRNPKEYAELWSGVLCPLFDCGDWFLRPYSFVLDINHLYCDKNKNTVSYVYVPSVSDCSDYNRLKEMAVEFSRQITVASADLENKVLRAIMIGFNPKAFIQMLKSSAAYNDHAARTPAAIPQRVNAQKALPMPDQAFTTKEDDHIDPMPDIKELHKMESVSGVPGEIIIDIPADRKPAKKAGKSVKNKRALSGANTGPKKRKNVGGVFKKKTNTRREAISETGFALKTDAASAFQPDFDPNLSSPPDYIVPDGIADITQCTSYEINGAWLRLVGAASLPPAIEVAIAEGEIFTIGRYDIAAGKQQSDFEFNRNTKAVSRRHAAIERRPEGYNLIDLASSAGTFIDGERLPPNTPWTLQSGCRVSFGNCGADYVWKQ